VIQASHCPALEILVGGQHAGTRPCEVRGTIHCGDSVLLELPQRPFRMASPITLNP
jgi:hypothetical protein